MQKFIALGLVAFSLNAQAESNIPKFNDVTASSGISSIYKGDWQYMVGGGVAVFDCNDDAKPEVFLAGGENNAQIFLNQSTIGGELKFSALERTGLEFDKTVGAYPIDIDSDGTMDLVVLRVGSSKIMHGLGKCMFADAAKEWNIDTGNSWTTAFAATWEQGQKWPSLAFGAYIDPAAEDEPWGSCTENRLLRPSPKGGYDVPLALTPSYCALGMMFTDWNRSGGVALRIANDREYYEGGQEQMWNVVPGAPPVLYGAAEGWKTQKFWGMGLASADINGDGLPEIATTSMADQRVQKLSASKDKPIYSDLPFSSGISAHVPYAGGDTRPSTGWHVQFADVNNDGLQDLFIAKGNVDAMPDFAAKDPNNLLLGTGEAKFIEAGEKAGLVDFSNHRGAQLADLNGDGKLDLVVVARRENAKIWQNISTDLGNFVELSVLRAGDNRNAIGAIVELKTETAPSLVQSQEIVVGGGHVSGQVGPTHFGIAKAVKAQIRVRWPDRSFSEWFDVEANKKYQFVQGTKPEELK